MIGFEAQGVIDLCVQELLILSCPSGIVCSSLSSLNAHQVGTNGLVSFETPYYGWWATNFPSIYPCIRNSYIVAPFWNDYDIRLRGNIWYSTIYADGLPAEHYNTTVLYTWSRFIAHQTGINPYSFQGTWALVATWEDVPHYPHFAAQQYPQYYSADYLEQLEEV